MVETTRELRARSMPRLISYGFLGFGIGGAIGGAIWVAFDAPHIGFAIFGAFGGAFLSLKRENLKRTVITALVCAVGFDIGLLFPFFIALAVWNPPFGQGFVIGCIGGAIGGVSLGIGLKEWRGIWLLTLAGAIGFGIGVQSTWDTLRGLQPQIFWGAITLLIWGIIGGALLGVALGYLEKKYIIR